MSFHAQPGSTNADEQCYPMARYFNNKWYAYTGLQPEQSLGAGQWQNPFHPADVPASRAAWSRSLATGEEYSVEYRCRRSDGVWRWQLGRAQAMFDANGKIVAWFGECLSQTAADTAVSRLTCVI